MMPQVSALMPDWLRVVSEIALVVLCPILLFIARTMMTFSNEMRSIRQALFGIDGNNGLAAEIKGLRVDRHRHSTMLTRHSFQIAHLAQSARIELPAGEEPGNG